MHCKRFTMGFFSIHKKVEETLYTPVKPLPWPVKDDHIWLVTGMMAPDCLELTYDLSIGFAHHGYRLFSFPLLYSQITAQELGYNFPGMGIGLGDVSEMEFRKAVAAALGLEMNPAAGYFIRKNPDGDGVLVAEIVAKTHRHFLLKVQPYLNELPEYKKKVGVKFSKQKEESDICSSIRFREVNELPLLSDALDDDMPYVSNVELRAQAREVHRLIEDLVMQDFPVEVIETWLQKAVKLSHLKVTADWRILLPDYGKEIKMRQLPKTLFLWFLRHPEGSSLKRLQEHRDELLDIYRKLTISDDQAQVEASIDALVNPLGNSFSEKCAAIKLAFLKEIPERVAKNYYIQGPQGGVKGISLDRGLVEWEKKKLLNLL